MTDFIKAVEAKPNEKIPQLNPGDTVSKKRDEGNLYGKPQEPAVPGKNGKCKERCGK